MYINNNTSLAIPNQEQLFETLSDEHCEQLTGGGWKKFWKKTKKTFDKVVLKALNNSDNSATQSGGMTGLTGYTAGEIALEETGMVGSGQIDGD